MDEPCLGPDGPDRFHQSPQEKTHSPPNPVPPAMGVTETIVQQLEEGRSTSPDSPMDRSSPGWRNFITKRSPTRPPPQIGPLANNPSNRSAKKTLSVDSPAFTPATLSVPSKSSAISSQAVNAAPFTPRGLASGKQVPRSASWERLTSEGTVTPIPQAETEPATFNPAQIKEFTPQQTYDISTNASPTPFSESRSR
jgi:PAB-dependent poly(A)-specific ribonuclease subunit 3